jgi:hypothetical protein
MWSLTARIPALLEPFLFSQNAAALPKRDFLFPPGVQKFVPFSCENDFPGWAKAHPKSAQTIA